MKTSEQSPSRRGILAALGLGGAAAASLSVLPRQSAETATVDQPRPKPEKGGGYALTEHVKRYYQTTRL